MVLRIVREEECILDASLGVRAAHVMIVLPAYLAHKDPTIQVSRCHDLRMARHGFVDSDHIDFSVNDRSECLLCPPGSYSEAYGACEASL